MINILFVVRKLDVGGMERLVIDLIKALDRKQYTPIVCTIESAGQLAPLLEESGIELIALNKLGGISVASILALREIIRSRQIDLIHSHNNTGHFYGALANRLLLKPKPLLHTKHGRENPDNPKAVLRNRLCSMLTDIVIPVSDDVGKVCHEIEKVPKSKLRTIINCVNIEPYIAAAKQPIDNGDNFHFGHVGRLYEVKNQQLMIRAFKRLVETRPKAKLSIVGDGPLRQELETLINQLNLNDHVFLLGYRSDIPELVAGFDCFLMSSTSEGTPLSVIEAMAAKNPVIGTDVGGMSEVVIENETGYLVPSNDVAEYTEKLLYAVDNPDKLQQLGQNGQNLALKKYKLEIMVNAYLRLYELALS